MMLALFQLGQDLKTLSRLGGLTRDELRRAFSELAHNILEVELTSPILCHSHCVDGRVGAQDAVIIIRETSHKRVRLKIICNARIKIVGKEELCMVLKLRIICKRTRTSARK